MKVFAIRGTPDFLKKGWLIFQRLVVDIQMFPRAHFLKFLLSIGIFRYISTPHFLY